MDKWRVGRPPRSPPITPAVRKNAEKRLTKPRFERGFAFRRELAACGTPRLLRGRGGGARPMPVLPASQHAWNPALHPCLVIFVGRPEQYATARLLREHGAV